MYAKWIHPKKIVIHEGRVLRHEGRITVHPKEKDYLRAGYFPLKITESQDLHDPENIYVVRGKSIVILEEDG